MHYFKTLTTLFAVVTLVSFTHPRKSIPQDWKFIGDKIAAYGTDRDVLWITGNDLYRQLKIRVTDAPLHIIDMDIYFENGEKMNVALRNKFRQGQESRVIDFPGGERRLKKVEFLYSTIGRAKGKARVAVWGNR